MVEYAAVASLLYCVVATYAAAAEQLATLCLVISQVSHSQPLIILSYHTFSNLPSQTFSPHTFPTNNQAKVCDFNLSRMIAQQQQLVNSGNPNSPGWQSPEMLSGAPYGKAADGEHWVRLVGWLCSEFVALPAIDSSMAQSSCICAVS